MHPEVVVGVALLCAGLWLRTSRAHWLTKRCDDGRCRREGGCFVSRTARQARRWGIGRKKQIVVERRTASPVVAEQAQGALPGGFIPEALSQASGVATPSFFLGDRSLEDLFGRIVVWHRCIRLETFLAPLVVRALLTLVSAAPAA
jgi:hypothetical protein